VGGASRGQRQAGQQQLVQRSKPCVAPHFRVWLSAASAWGCNVLVAACGVSSYRVDRPPLPWRAGGQPRTEATLTMLTGPRRPSVMASISFHSVVRSPIRRFRLQPTCRAVAIRAVLVECAVLPCCRARVHNCGSICRLAEPQRTLDAIDRSLHTRPAGYLQQNSQPTVLLPCAPLLAKQLLATIMSGGATQ
jgi:hypothetical protein